MLKSRVFNLFDRAEPVKFFVVVAAIFGLLFILITPPFQGADEIVHFYRAYQVSELNLVADQQGKHTGGKLPESLEQVVVKTEPSQIKFLPQNKYKEGHTKSALEVPNNLSDKKFYDFTASAAYSPIPYAGASAGIGVSRLLHFPVLVSLYAARLGNLVAWIILVACAIAFVPKRKWVLVVLGLIPMAIFQAATLNADAVTIGSSFTFIALILKYREASKVLGRKQLGILLFLAMIMVLGKQVMVALLPLILLLPKNSFASYKKMLIAKIILILFPFAIAGLWMLISSTSDVATIYENHQDPAGQISFILHSPQSFINVMWNTYFYSWGDNVTRSFIGVFGWADAPLSELIVTISYVILAIIMLGNGGKDSFASLTKNSRRVILSVATIYWLVVSASLYIYYSPLGFKIIYGLQGRYFLPLAIILFAMTPNKSIRIDKLLYKRLSTVTPVVLLMASTITIYVRYFINNV